MKNPDNKKDELGWGRRIAANPWVGLGGLVAAAISIIVAVVLYSTAQTERELVYAVNPIYTKVVTAGQTTTLEILHNGVQLGDVDITAVQIAIWNSGKESIRQENVLEDVVIHTDPPVPILEASIRKLSREVTEFTVLSSPELLAAGVVPVSWRILENNDGASIQLIYIGSEEIDVSVQGVIEGIHEVKRVEPGVKIKTPLQQVRDEQRLRWIFIALTIVTGIGVVFTSFLFFSRKMRSGFIIIVFVYSLGFFGFILWNLLSKVGSWPPFGF